MFINIYINNFKKCKFLNNKRTDKNFVINPINGGVPANANKAKIKAEDIKVIIFNFLKSENIWKELGVIR